MALSKRTALVAGVAALALAVGAGRLAIAQPPTGDVIGELANNEGIFVDGKTFKIARGKAKGDPAAQIAKMGAKEVGPGAIVFRYNDKLYLVEGTPPLPRINCSRAAASRASSAREVSKSRLRSA